MKNPLSYQLTEYDCGPTSMLNAMSFLFRREEIPPEVVKHIMLYCLDGYNDRGECGKDGTTKLAMQFLCGWLNQYGKVVKFPLCCEELAPHEVTVAPGSRLLAALRQSGAALVRLRYDCWHYVLFTGVDERHVYLFDPYYRRQPFRQGDIKILTDAPAKWNRKVPLHYFESESLGPGPYALGPKDTREAILLFNAATRKPQDGAIEYFI